MQPLSIPISPQRVGPAAQEAQARNSRQGADDWTGGLAPIPSRCAPIVAHPGGAAASLAPSAIQDDPNAADRLEGTLDFGKKERAIGRNDRIAKPGGEESPRTLRADTVGHQGVPRLPLRDRRAAPRADGPHRRGCYPRCPRFAKHFLARVGRIPSDLKILTAKDTQRQRWVPGTPSPEQLLGQSKERRF
jgi:hypothetical protein